MLNLLLSNVCGKNVTVGSINNKMYNNLSLISI